MYPLICKIGPFSIYSYGLMLALAFMISVALAIQEAKRKNFDPDIIFNFSFIIFIVGIVGARFFYIIENAAYYLKAPLEIVMLQHGGLSWYGGLIFAIIFSAVYLKNKKLSLYKTADLMIPFVALAQAIGRIGCLLNGCCFGKPTAKGIYFPTHLAVLIPIQLYASLLLISIFVILRLLQNKPHKDGEIFFTYLILYSLKRYFIEFWRADNPIIFAGLTLFQILSLILLFFSLPKFFLLKRAKH